MSDRWTLPDRSSALSWCAMRNDAGIRCILDILGRYYRDEEHARQSHDAYLELAEEISVRKLNSSITVKPSTLGGTFKGDLTLKLAEELCARCRERGIGFEVDMEGQRMVDLTLRLAENCARSGLPLTIALQAYLKRTPEDLERMIDVGVKVRLVKGAYSGDISDFSMIAEVTKDLIEDLIAQDVPFCVGTHDPDILEWTTERLKDKDIIEYGFLKGLADGTKERFVARGWRVAEYVPFGPNGEGYEARRNTYLKRLSEMGREPAP